MNLKYMCKQLLNDLSKYKHTDKSELLLFYVNERLSKSHSTYEKELSESADYLKHRNELNLLRKMNKIL